MKSKDFYATSIYSDYFADTDWIDKAVEYAQNLEQVNTNARSIRNGWQSQGVLYRHKHFAKFADWILTKIQTEILENKVKPFMSNMWLNVQNQHGYNLQHVHSGSWFSGVLYLKCPEQSGSIVFTDPRPAVDNSYYYNQYAPNFGKNIMWDPHVGDVLLFPAFLPHLVQPNPSTEQRISLSFNIELDV